MQPFKNGTFVLTLLTILSQVIYSSVFIKILSIALLSYYIFLLWKHNLANEPSLFLLSLLVLLIYLLFRLLQYTFQLF